jgi:ferredoxin
MYVATLPFFPLIKEGYDINSIKTDESIMMQLYPEIYSCVGCNACTNSCSQGLNVMQYIAYAQRGDYEKWLEIARQIRASHRKEPLVALAASFGSVLLKPLRFLPFIVNLYGTTGSGKTVTLMLAASVWANPSEGAYISESNSTLNAMEMKLDVLNHLPMMVDDLSKLRSENKAGLMDMIYGLCAGNGKSRLSRNGEIRYTPTWCNAIVTNMERPLSDDTMRGGAMNRILDFEVEPGDIYKDGNHVVNILSDNYGIAGVKFVEAVRKIDTDKLRAMVRKYREKIKAYALELGEEREEKQITPLAIMLTADLISEQIIFQDGVHLDFEWSMKSVKSKRQVSEMERAYKHFIDAYHINQARFNDDTSLNYGEVWGKKQVGDYIAIIPTARETRK